MHKNMKMILKAFALILSWLTLSPLFFYLAKKWGLMNKGWRITLLLISPLFLVGYLLIGAFIFFEYAEYERKHGFLDKDRIERITEVRLPDFELVECKMGDMNFRGEYSDELTIEFEDSLTNDFYATLDSLVEKKVWSKSKDTGRYSFSTMWGNGIPAPEGENDETDIMFSITIEKGTNRAVIGTGSW